MTLEQIPYLVEELQLNVSLKILDHKLVTSFVCIDLEHNGFLNDRFSSKLTQFIESGIFNHWRSHHVVELNQTETSEPQVLTMEHLSAGFFLFLICLLISIFFFIFELLKFNIERRC